MLFYCKNQFIRLLFLFKYQNINEYDLIVDANKMIKRFGKLLNQRSFLTTKDSKQLKEQFQKLTEHNKAATQITEENTEKIQLTDQEKARDELKQKFEGIKKDLGKNTGEAKSAYVRIFEAAKNFKVPKVSISEITNKFIPKEQKKPAEDVSKKQEDNPSTTSEENTAKTTAENPKKTQEKTDNFSDSAKKPLNETTKPRTSYIKDLTKNYPKVEKAINFTSTKLSELIKETFPNRDDKIMRLKEIHEMRRLSKEIDEKIARGEISEADIPE